MEVREAQSTKQIRGLAPWPILSSAVQAPVTRLMLLYRVYIADAFSLQHKPFMAARCDYSLRHARLYCLFYDETCM